jgi:broad specificity phosphatase PhoE
MKIIIIRHAESLGNQTGNYGLFDPPITDKGRSQSLDTQGKLDYDHGKMLILVSPSTRAIETLEIIFPQQKMYLTHLLREYNTHVGYNNVQDSKTLEKYNHDITFLSDELPHELSWQDGENRVTRLLSFIEGIKSLNLYDTIVLGTHGNFGRNLLMRLGKGDYHLENAQFIVI